MEHAYSYFKILWLTAIHPVVDVKCLDLTPDNCDTAGVCKAFPKNPLNFLQNVVYGDTFIQFALNSPVSYDNCDTGPVDVCGER